tara:strand:- start:53536 stop:54522 length:987 start_codon:yes stop_codon:yes gene_type:complete
MPKFTNNENLPIAVAVWLAHDDYDHDDDPYTISATTLLKPLKQIILSARVPEEDKPVDISSLVKSRIGTAIHDSIEKVWVTRDKLVTALKALGYKSRAIKRVVVNPKPEELTPDCVPVYLENRVKKKVGKWTVSGKYDFIVEGVVEDFKSTSTFTYTSGNKVDDYKRQGSLYRWLNPDVITADYMHINFIFTDFSMGVAKRTPGYPSNQIVSQRITLEPVTTVQAFVERKLAQIESLFNAPEEQLPKCTDADLWVDDPVYKYYKNPAKKARATKNFDTLAEAQKRLADDNFVGVVEEVKGKVKACKYCSAFPVCQQKDEYIHNGRLEL